MRRWVVITVGVVAFLAISFLLARWLTVDNAEREKVETLLRAQAAGDGAALARDIAGCAADPACTAKTAAQARMLKTPGRVEIVAYDSATAHALGAKDGPTRVVWKTAARLTTVQCVQIRRTGSVLSGASVTVTALSEPIDRQAGC
ncbi:MAG: hypothetical protein JWP17_3577 [Solirubrobacterales bacterium]|jgi:hypothetical protein|nr:hypothetical protein [Solirubrobacterales bacterium]